MRIDDPWHDTLASGWQEETGPSAAPATAPMRPAGSNDPPRQSGGPAETGRIDPPPPSGPPGPPEPSGRTRAADVYLTVQRSDAFQQVRRRHRGFVLPATAAFLLWYLGYLVTAVTAPGLMARPVAGVLNVAMAAGLAQFVTTFLLTWAYARHARRHRDPAALELRWETQEMTRKLAGEAVR